jgi:hypothetical protein
MNINILCSQVPLSVDRKGKDSLIDRRAMWCVKTVTESIEFDLQKLKTFFSIEGYCKVLGLTHVWWWRAGGLSKSLLLITHFIHSVKYVPTQQTMSSIIFSKRFFRLFDKVWFIDSGRFYSNKNDDKYRLISIIE